MNNHTDKELLILAAKAAGFNVKMFEVDQDENFSGLIVGTKNTKEKIWWNPLVSDGDALRLAVNLELMIDNSDGVSYAIFRGHSVSEEGDDPYAATRRAIVRAAAAIGSKL